jgi:cellulose biosynthesis protein BcsQ
MARVVALAQRKGGCGKTSFAVSLAAVGVSRAFQTATVDLDSQANASAWALGAATVRGVSRERSAALLEWPPRRDWLSLSSPLRADSVTPEQVLEYAVSHCRHESQSVPGLAVYPLSPGVHCDEATELLISGLPHDWVIVDTPANSSTPATRSALAQSDFVLVPVLASSFAIWGAEMVLREIESVGRADLIETGRVRLVINGRQKWAVQDAAEQEIRARYGELVAVDVVPWGVRIGEASMAPELLKKTNPIWKAAERIWDELEPKQSRNRRAAA